MSRELGFIPVPVVPKSCFPVPTQLVTVEILISRSHPNDSREKVYFPVVFRSRAVKSRGNIDFLNPAHTRTVGKKEKSRGKYSRVSCVHGLTQREQTARAYSYICRRGVRHRTGLGSPVYHVFFLHRRHFCVFGFAYTYVVPF